MESPFDPEVRMSIRLRSTRRSDASRLIWFERSNLEVNQSAPDTVASATSNLSEVNTHYGTDVQWLPFNSQMFASGFASQELSVAWLQQLKTEDLRPKSCELVF